MTKLVIPTRYKPTGTTFPGGGMSDACLCHDSHLNRPVIIKSLKDGIDPKRILDELAALQAIRSKHVVQIFDVIRDHDGAVLAIVEEFLSGSDLLSAPRPNTVEELLRLLYPVSEGIADIHAHGRVHRDIKPNNMKYDGENCLKIFDFGLSRLEGTEAQTITIAGTPGYTAPELFLLGTDGKIQFTQAIDTFAFGATALQLAAGNLPAPLRRLPPRLPCAGTDFSGLTIKLPSDVASSLTACLQEEPNDRPDMATIRDLIAAHLLRDRHRAILFAGEATHELSSSRRIVDIALKGLGQIRITYDGLRFTISNLSGDVSINNMTVINGHVLTGSCVIVLGPRSLGNRRVNVTVDISHPEVGL